MDIAPRELPIITVVQGNDGEYGAFTTQEPLFFLTDFDVSSLRSRIEEVMSDYAQTFLSQNVTIVVTETETAPAPIRVKKIASFEAAYA